MRLPRKGTIGKRPIFVKSEGNRALAHSVTCLERPVEHPDSSWKQGKGDIACIVCVCVSKHQKLSVNFPALILSKSSSIALAKIVKTCSKMGLG